MSISLSLRTLACGLPFAISPIALAQEDNFDDGDVSDWTENDPLGGIGAGPLASFSATGGEYRLTAAASPNPAAVGPGRAGTFRQDVTYVDDFYLSVDVPAFATNEQTFGLIAMVQPTIGLGMTDGYAFTYQPVTNDIQITRIVDEAQENAFESNVDLAVAPGPAVRLVFVGRGGVMVGHMYNLDDLTTPLATTTATDTLYTSGTCGLIVANNQTDGAGTADATFDNYIANDGSTPALELALDGVTTPSIGDEFFVRYPDWALIGFQLERSTSLETGDWQPVPSAQVLPQNGFLEVFGEFGVGSGIFYRLRRE